MKKSYEIDMCNGPLFGKILTFSLPLMLSGILQLLFNAADTVVVGRFAGSTALAAVGSTSSLINLLTNLFIGFSVGANVLIARFYGAKKEKDASETVHIASGAGSCGYQADFSVDGDTGGSVRTGCPLYENIFYGDAGNASLQFWQFYFESHRGY